MEQNKTSLCLWFIFVTFLAICIQFGIMINTDFIMSFSMMFFLCFMYAYTGEAPGKLLIYSLVLAFTASIPAFMYLHNTQFSLTNSNDDSSTFSHAYLLYKFFIFIFFYSWFRDKQFPANYSSLVKSTWNTIACAVLVILIVIPLGILAGILFASLGTHFFSADFINQLSNIKDPNQFSQFLSSNGIDLNYFLIGFGSTLALLQVIGFMIAKTHQSWIDKFEDFILRLSRYVFIIMSFIGLAHVVYYLLQVFGIKPENNTLTNLLSFGFFAIVFFNGYYQDGNTSYQPKGFVSFIIKLFRLVFFLCALVVGVKYIGSAGLNLNQYLWALFIVLYLGLYGITAFMSADREKALIQTWNTRLALLFVAAFAIMNIGLYLS